MTASQLRETVLIKCQNQASECKTTSERMEKAFSSFKEWEARTQVSRLEGDLMLIKESIRHLDHLNRLIEESGPDYIIS